MNREDALSLGRVSNLPTVWTNMLAAIALVGGSPGIGTWLPLILSLSLFYIGGMYLNDAFDASIDRKERPDRPIPSGRVKRSTVFLAGFAMMGIGLLLLLFVGFGIPMGNGLFPFLGGVGLALSIILYNAWHKGNPMSPFLMGLCRVLVYLTTALCFAVSQPAGFWLGAAMLLCYLIGLTYTAKQENLNEIGHLWPLLFLIAPVFYGIWLAGGSLVTWILLIVFVCWVLYALWHVKRRNPGDIPKAVVSLIAGMCLLDAIIIAGHGQMKLAALAVIGFVLTLFFQRYVSGT